MLDQVTLIHDSCEVQILGNHHDLFEIEQEWRDLEVQCEGATLFQSYDWCHSTLVNMDTQDQKNLFVCTVRKGGRLIALLPLRVMKKRGRKILTGLAEPFQEFTDMLVTPGIPYREIFPAIEAQLRKSRADYLHLGQVRKDSALYQVLKGHVFGVGEVDQAPYVDMTEWEDHAAYFRSVRAHTRKNIRNARNKMEKSGPITFESADNGPLLEGVICRCFENRELWLKEKGLTSRAFGNADFERFVNQFKHGKFDTLQARAFSLRHAGQPIAEQWGIVYRGRYYAYIMSWSPAFAQYSPGKLKMQEIVRDCFANNVEKAEFMIPMSGYKMTWATGTVEVQDFVQPFTLVGNLYANIWIDKLRPTLKRIALALPPVLRRQISGLIKAAQ